MTNVLLIEDNLGDAILVKELYKEADVVGDEYVITHVLRISEALNELTTSEYDLIISDLSLPDTQGLDTLNQIIRSSPNTPVILMTGTNNDSFISEALNLGAQDYLVKGVTDSQVLARATTYAIERKKAQNRINAETKRANDLGQQNNELMMLNKAKDDFISLASHQLRTPATVVKQYLGIMLDGFSKQQINGELRKYIEIAYDNNDRQLKIINDLLKTAQYDAGYTTLRLEEHDITELIHEICRDYSPLALANNQTINCPDHPPELAHVDAAELKIALSNLIENAIKYSKSGTTTSIDLRRTPDMLQVIIQDEGVGIKEKDIHLIFNRFSRVDNELSDTVDGNGLGLYFVSRIVELHNGTIEVTSDTSKGTTFTISLPS